MADFNTETKPKKSSSGCGKYFFLFFLILIVVGGGFAYWKYFYDFSEGSRTGLLQKFSHKGNVLKTYEGELMLSSVTTTSNGAGIASEKFFFSVENDSVAAALMGMEGKWVRVHYNEKNGTLPWRGDTRYIVDGFTMEVAPILQGSPMGYPNQQYPQQQYPQQQPQQYPQQQPQNPQQQQYQQPTQPQQYQPQQQVPQQQQQYQQQQPTQSPQQYQQQPLPQQQVPVQPQPVQQQPVQQPVQ